jgi:hypothetical protein
MNTTNRMVLRRYTVLLEGTTTITNIMMPHSTHCSRARRLGGSSIKITSHEESELIGTLNTMDGQQSTPQYSQQRQQWNEFEFIGGRYSSVDRYAETN